MHPLLLSLNLDYPGLEAVKAAYDAGNVSLALDELVRYYRTRPEPDPELLAQADAAQVEAAEVALRHQFVFYNEPGTVPGELMDWTYKPGIDWEWTWALNRHGWWPQLASAYLATRDERYMRELDMLIRTWVGGHPPTVEDHSAWRTIEAGIRTFSAWPYILSAMKISPSITREAWLYYLRSIADHAEFLLAHPKGGNWLLMETNGVLTCGLIFPEFKRAGEWVSAAIAKLEHEMEGQVHPDGSQVEYSTHYHFVCIRNFEEPLVKVERAQARGAKFGFSEAYRQRLIAMWENVMYLMRPDGYQPMFNDADNLHVAPMLAAAGERYNRPDFIYVATNGAQGKPPADLSHRFPWVRRAVMRSGYDEDAYYAILETAPFGYGHQHEDTLTFELHAHRQRLVGTMGRYTYARVPLRAYLISSEAHNVILVDGQGQDQHSLIFPSGGKVRPEVWMAQAETRDPWISTPALDIAYGSYSGPWTGGLERITWERWLAFHKPAENSPAFWVVCDRLQGAGEHELTFLLHFFPGSNLTVDQDAGRFRTRFTAGQGNLLGIFTRQGLAFDAACGQEDPPRGWYSDEYGKLEPTWELRARCQAALPDEGYMVFVPFQGDSAPEVQVETLPGGVRVTVDGKQGEVIFPAGS